MNLDEIRAYERYSDDIRHAMVIANREAKWHLQPRIDTPHMFIALAVEQTGLARAVLYQRGVTPAIVRRTVHKRIPRGWFLSFFGRLRQTQLVKDMIGEAVIYAVSEKHDSVGTGGILLALIRNDPMTSELLGLMSVDKSELETSLKRYLHRMMVEAPLQAVPLDPFEMTA